MNDIDDRSKISKTAMDMQHGNLYKKISNNASEYILCKPYNHIYLNFEIMYFDLNGMLLVQPRRVPCRTERPFPPRESYFALI